MTVTILSKEEMRRKIQEEFSSELVQSLGEDPGDIGFDTPEEEEAYRVILRAAKELWEAQQALRQKAEREVGRHAESRKNGDAT